MRSLRSVSALRCTALGAQGHVPCAPGFGPGDRPPHRAARVPFPHDGSSALTCKIRPHGKEAHPWSPAVRACRGWVRIASLRIRRHGSLWEDAMGRIAFTTRSATRLCALWAGVLVALPYCVSNITGPVLPAQMTVTPICVAVVISVLRRSVLYGAKQGRAKYPMLARGVLISIGLVATGILALVEGYAVVRGRGFLLDERSIALNTWLALVEFLAAIVALLGWDGLYERVAEDGAQGENGHLALRIVPAAMGYMLPALSSAAAALGIESAPVSLAVCAAFGIGATVALLVWLRHGYGDADDPKLVLAGFLVFSIAHCLAQGESSYYGFPMGTPCPLWYAAVPCAFAASVLIERHATHGAASVGRTLTSPVPRLVGERTDLLSSRESEVLARMLSDEPTASIASVMGVSESTVATYRYRGFRKLGVSDRRELNSYARSGAVAVSSARDKTEPVRTRGETAVIVFLIAASLFPRIVRLLGPIFPGMSGLFGTWHMSVWIAALVLLVVGAVLIVAPPSSAEYRGGAEGKDLTEDAMRSVLMLLFAVYVSDLRSTVGAWGFLTLLVVVLACGARGYCQMVQQGADVGLSAALRVLRAGARGFARSVPSSAILLGCAALGYWNIQSSLGPVLPLTAFWLLLIILTCVLSVREILCSQHAKAGRGDARAALLSLLRSKGMSELQVEVLVDSIEGYSVAEICERRSTTENTVKSYRRRGCRSFGVKSIGELRRVLENEQVATGGNELHP